MARRDWSKGAGGPWYGIPRERILFERGFQKLYPMTEIRTSGHRASALRSYEFLLPVPRFDPREVDIRFAGPQTHPSPQVFVDGPTESPHRFDDGSLCMWFRRDPSALVWLPFDGLVRLLDHVRLHLIKEAVWRETGRWMGPELGHSTQSAGEQ